MDDGNKPTTDGASISPHASRDTDFAPRRVTSATEQDRPSSSRRSPENVFRTTASRHPVDNPAPSNPRWAAAPSALDTLVEAAERPGKRVRLDDDAAAPVRASSPGDWSATRPSPKRHRRDSSDLVLSSPGVGHDTLQRCPSCWDCDQDLTLIVEGLIELRGELARISPNDLSMAASTSATAAGDVTKHGLRHTLSWAATEIRKTLKDAHGAASAATASHGPVSGISPNIAYPRNMRRLSIQSQSPYVATPRQEPLLPTPSSANPARLDQYSSIRDRMHSTSLPPIIPPDDMKRGQIYEQPVPGPAQSPQTSSGSSIYGPGQSPMQSLSVGRSLPSPPGSHFNHAGLPSSTHSHASASQAHLDNLQHQISTKSLALTTLQREHDQLLAAFSRSQIRCSTLDKKSQVSDHEINTLTEEKIRLQQQVDALEAQVDDLTKAREELQRQSTADGAQWRQIMAMSSQLQIKGAEEAKLHKAAQEAWDRQREDLERRIEELETQAGATPRHSRETNTEPSLVPADDEGVIGSHSMQAMEAEVLRLRTRLADLETLLREVTGEAEQIDRAMKAMVNIRARISGQIPSHGDIAQG